MQENLVAEIQTLFFFVPISWWFNYSIFLFTTGVWIKVQGRKFCLHRHCWSSKGHRHFQTEIGNPAWTSSLQPEATSQPPTPRKSVFSWDTHSREQLHCFLFCSKSRYERLPITQPQIAFTSKGGCVSLVSFLFYAGEKTLGWLHWTLLTHMPELWNLSLPPPSQSASACALGCTGPSLRLEGQFGSHCLLPH